MGTIGHTKAHRTEGQIVGAWDRTDLAGNGLADAYAGRASKLFSPVEVDVLVVLRGW